jgi:hypothetical protein
MGGTICTLKRACSCTCDPLVLLPGHDRVRQSGEGAPSDFGLIRSPTRSALAPVVDSILGMPETWPAVLDCRSGRCTTRLEVKFDAFSKTQRNWLCQCSRSEGVPTGPEVGAAHSGGPLAASVRNARQWQPPDRQSGISQACSWGDRSVLEEPHRRILVGQCCERLEVW